MRIRKASLIVIAFLGVALLLTQTSCGGSSRAGRSSGGAKPLAARSTSTQSQRTTVYFGDEVTVVRHAGRTYVKVRDDDNGDGIPDED